MSAGTITLTNNSDLVAGLTTKFITDLKPGDMVVVVVGGITYTLPVKSIESNTNLTIIKAYDGPTQGGTSWSAIPRDTMNAITAQLAAETAKALRGLNYDKNNWQQVFSQSTDITVRLPDGSTFQGPSWLKVADLLKEIDIDVMQGIADSVNSDALQVSADKSVVVDAANRANISANAAEEGKNNAASSAASAVASAGAAESSKNSAASSAESAKNDADRAEAANPDKALLQKNNLSEISTTEAKATARGNLGLGSAATKNIGGDVGEVMIVGNKVLSVDVASNFGFGSIPKYGFISSGTVLNGAYMQNSWMEVTYPGQWTIYCSHGIVTTTFLANEVGHAFSMTDGRGWVKNWVMYNDGNLMSPIGLMWGPKNTAVDANGYIRTASPIVKLFGTGKSEANDEAIGVVTERVSKGVYRLSGSIMGFNSDAAWHIEIPRDENKQSLIWVDYDVEANGDIIVKTYHRTHPNAPTFAQNAIKGYNDGDPIDIPSGRWLDLRVHVYSEDAETVTTAKDS